MSQEPHKENFVERLFDHHGHHGHEGKSGEHSQSGAQGQQQQQGGQQQPQHKEGEMDKFRDYIKKDEQMEQQDGAYGGLM